jgi:prepilin-type N-terminal cleavage/methylation domain-containing protein
MTHGRRPGHARAAAAAFTLVEILVVVVILGIAAAVIVPQMGTRDDLRVDGARRMLMADLIYAQNRSISTQTRHYVVFDTNSSPRTYKIVTNLSAANPNGTPVQHPVTRADEFKAVFGLNAPSGAQNITHGLEVIGLGTVNIEGHNVLCFDELGVPYFYDAPTDSTTATSITGGSSIEVKCGTFTKLITVEPYTGEVLAP